MDRKPSRRSYGRSNSRYKKSCKEKCKDFIRQFIAFMFTNVGIIGLVVGYTIAGAFTFIAIEGSQNDTLAANLTIMRDTAIEELWDLTITLNVLNEDSWMKHVNDTLRRYQNTFVDSVRQGYDPKFEESWSFSGAFLYSLTVITTIGYGNVAPRTVWGKLATIIYAIIGMPLFLLYLSNIGDILAKSFKWIYTRVCLCRGCPGTESFRKKRAKQQLKQQQKQDIQLSKMQPSVDRFSKDWQLDEVQRRSGSKRASASETEDEDSDDEDSEEEEEDDDDKEGDDESESDPQTVTVPISVCLTVMVGYVCGGALLFSRWEDWKFLDGSYFCFISLSTIGFGDIVPGDKIYKSKIIEISFILTAAYLMLGMALIAMCFNLMQEEVVHKTRSCIKICKDIFYCCTRQKSPPER